MFKKLLFISLYFFPLQLLAQLAINAQLPPGGLIQKDQLWNLVVVNNSQDLKDVNLKMTIQEPGSGQIILSATTGNILIGKGIKIITSKEIQPINYNYYSMDLTKEFLPMGSYVVCYQAYSNGSKAELLSDDCLKINIDPLSPPLLNMPLDKSEIQTPYPQFTWMPPSPYTLFTNLNYEIVVTEVLPGQSSTEAIDVNTPLFSKSNISQTYESYPQSFKALDTSKIYAWQVIARNGAEYSAKTEVWTFTLAKPEKKNEILTHSYYIQLEDGLSDTYIISGSMLKIKFHSFDKEFDAQVVFTDEKNRTILELKQKVIYGDNFFDFTLNNDFKKGSFYKVTIKDRSNSVHTLKFKITK